MAVKKNQTVEKTEDAVQEVQDQTFTKEQFLKSKLYDEKRDLVNALLDDNKKYTKDEVEELIQSFMTGERKGE